MTRITIFIAALLLMASCNGPQTAENKALSTKDIDSLYQHHQFFKLRDQLTEHGHLLPEKELMLLEAQLLSVFNRRQASNEIIAELRKKYQNDFSAKEEIDLLENEIANSLFLFNYAEAQHAVRKLLKNDSLSVDKRREYQNQLLIFKDLQETPPQEIEIIPGELDIRKDLAGLSRIPVEINALEEEVVFDTGANLSVITDSLAIKAGIPIGKSIFKVTAITGEKVNSKIGVADSLRIGNTLLRNVVFLVFPEASLSFEKANYTIDAILGFPVINAMEKIELIEGKRFVISGSPETSLKENMALDLLTPIIEVYQDGRHLTFTFDTGASSTALYEQYLKLHEPFILENGVRDSISQGGAGGAVRIPVYKAPFSGVIAGREFHLDSANIHIKNQNDYPGIYGNLGQDVLRQFDTLSLNFRNMRVELK